MCSLRVRWTYDSSLHPRRVQYLYEDAQAVAGQVPNWAWTARCFSIPKLPSTVEINNL